MLPNCHMILPHTSRNILVSRYPTQICVVYK